MKTSTGDLKTLKMVRGTMFGVLRLKVLTGQISVLSESCGDSGIFIKNVAAIDGGNKVKIEWSFGLVCTPCLISFYMLWGNGMIVLLAKAASL